ncbi:unnamed protein product, partial [Timema podura]|nr:unnamed protein product [Timema podura]
NIMLIVDDSMCLWTRGLLQPCDWTDVPSSTCDHFAGVISHQVTPVEGPWTINLDDGLLLVPTSFVFLLNSHMWHNELWSHGTPNSPPWHTGCNISGRLVQSPAAGFCLYKSNWRLSLNGEPPWTADSTFHCLPSCDRS